MGIIRLGKVLKVGKHYKKLNESEKREFVTIFVNCGRHCPIFDASVFNKVNAEE